LYSLGHQEIGTNMRKTFTTAALAALIALPLIGGASSADASCRGRANTGTAIGAVGGALVGNSISKGGGGAVIGGLGGAVLGHQIGKSGCTNSSRHASYRTRHSRYAARAPSRVYYDQNGNAIRR
jgi:hypothetical protein